MNWLGRCVVLAALFLAALLAVGCGGTAIDPSKVQGEVKENIEKVKQTKVSSVACPSGVEVEPKAKFSCTVRLANGKTETATLQIVDSNANLNFLNLRPDK